MKTIANPDDYQIITVYYEGWGVGGVEMTIQGTLVRDVCQCSLIS